MRAHRLFRWIGGLLLFSLAACAPAGPAPTPTLAPDRLWSPDPDAVIFRAEIISPGLPELARQSEVPACTIYGDTRVVWVNALGGFRSEVLFDTVGDAAVEAFISQLAIGEDFYNLTTGEPDPAAPEASYAQVLVDVGGRPHRADSRGNWDAGFFERVLAQCVTLSSTPIRFEPRAAWLTAREMPSESGAPLYAWPAQLGSSLAALADGQPHWLSGDGIVELWNLQRSTPYTVLLTDAGRNFAFALQLPGITRDAPAAPAGS